MHMLEIYYASVVYRRKIIFIKTGRRSLTMHLHMQLLQILEQQDFGEFFVDNCSESSDLVRGRVM